MSPSKLPATQRTDSFPDLAATVWWVSLTECALTRFYSYNQSLWHKSLYFNKAGSVIGNVLGGKDDRRFIRDKDGKKPSSSEEPMNRKHFWDCNQETASLIDTTSQASCRAQDFEHRLCHLYIVTPVTSSIKWPTRSVTGLNCDVLYIMISAHLPGEAKAMLHTFKRLVFSLKLFFIWQWNSGEKSHVVFYHKLPFSIGSLGRIRTEAVFPRTTVH